MTLSISVDSDAFFERASLTKRERRAMKRAESLRPPTLSRIEPKTENQRRVFESYAAGQNLILHGVAGTGKTFLSLYLALEAAIAGREPKPVVVMRSVVPTRDMGFLPGGVAEKAAVYELPYSAILKQLTGKTDAYDRLKTLGYVQFSTTSFVRGLTFRDNTVIVDECQNMTFHELDSIITRMGDGCRVIFSGDFRQSDLWRDDERNGLQKFMRICSKMKSFTRVEFTKDDIVRSDLVRDYIVAKLEEGVV